MKLFPLLVASLTLAAGPQPASAGVRSVEQKLTAEENLQVIERLRVERFSKEPPTVQVVYQPRYSTLCHRALQNEKAVGVLTDDMLKLVDRLVDEAKTRKIGANIGTRDNVLNALGEIDRLLIDHSFVYPPVGFTQMLSDGLVPHFPDKSELAAIKSQPHNARRVAYVNANPGGPFRYIDCDTASLLYIGIGEVIGLPLSMVEVPDHNFVRHVLADGKHINWETMDGTARSDEEYKRSYGVSEDQIKLGTYLSTMSPENTLGYWHFVIGIPWEQKKRWSLALEHYLKATTMNPCSPGGWNNAAWTLCTSRDAAVRNGTKAVEYATKAVELERSANLLDTLACAHAESGNFEKAVEIQTEACRIGGSAFKKTLDGFLRKKTWLQQNPEAEEFSVLNANR